MQLSYGFGSLLVTVRVNWIFDGMSKLTIKYTVAGG